MSQREEGRESLIPEADIQSILGIAHGMNTSVQVLAMNLGFLRKAHVRMSMLLGLHRASLHHYPEGVMERLLRAEEELDLEFFLGETPKVLTESGEGAAKVVEAIRRLKGMVGVPGEGEPRMEGPRGEEEADERAVNVI